MVKLSRHRRPADEDIETIRLRVAATAETCKSTLLAGSELARQLDPLSVIIASDQATILYYSRQYDNALKQFRSVLELEPTNRARYSMIPVYLQLGRYGEAAELVNHWPDQDADSSRLAWKAAVHGRSAHPEHARHALAKLEQVSGPRAVQTATLLLAYSGTGKELAIELLRRAYSEHSNAVVQIKVDPMYDPMRSDPGSRICCAVLDWSTRETND